MIYPYSVVRDILEPYRKSIISYNRLSELLEADKRILKRKQDRNINCDCLLKQIQSLEKQMNEIDTKGERIFKALSNLSGAEYEIVYYYYVSALTMEQVFTKLYFSPRKIYYFKKRALKKLENLYTGGFI